MEIRIGQPFRVTRDGADRQGVTRSGLVSYDFLTSGRIGVSINTSRGISAYRTIQETSTCRVRRPAVILLSNPFKAESAETPWVDVVDPDSGYALFYGDNRTPGRPAWAAHGNRLLLDLFPLYRDPQTRSLAPPILLFRQLPFAGKRKGAREFCGFGVPTNLSYVVQKEPHKEGRFANLVAELVLLGLEDEGELFDWDWIDDRRDPSVPLESANSEAPRSWKTWVEQGDRALENCRRRVLRTRVSTPGDQSARSLPEAEILEQIRRYYSVKPHMFEGLAAQVASRFVGPKCEPMWVTKRSGDGGIDFVCRQTVGEGFGATRTVVLGQAKCLGANSSISGKDLARVVARLRRGWIGAFVTTGVFSRAAQLELLEDQYPIVLVNGTRLAREVRSWALKEGVSVLQILEAADQWYATNLRPLDPSRAVDVESAPLVRGARTEARDEPPLRSGA